MQDPVKVRAGPKSEPPCVLGREAGSLQSSPGSCLKIQPTNILYREFPDLIGSVTAPAPLTSEFYCEPVMRSS